MQDFCLQGVWPETTQQAKYPELLEMARNGWNGCIGWTWLEIAGNGWKWLEMAGNS